MMGQASRAMVSRVSAFAVVGVLTFVALVWAEGTALAQGAPSEASPPASGRAESEPAESVVGEPGAAEPVGEGSMAVGLGAAEAGAAEPRADQSLGGEPVATTAATPAPEDAPHTWEGPRVELGFSHFVLSDGHGAGSVNAGFFGGYLPFGSWPRIGLSVEAGVRSYALGPDDFLLRGTLVAGYQHFGLDRFLPYAVLVGTMGPLIGKRFRTSIVEFLMGVGVELGADVNIVENLFAGVGLSYIRATMEDLSYDLFLVRLRIGL